MWLGLGWTKAGPVATALKAARVRPSAKHAKNGVQLKMLAAPLHPADVNQIEGKYPLKPSGSAQHEADEDPFWLGGSEGVARIESMAASHPHFEVGDRVLCARTVGGTWQQYVETTTSAILPVPTEAQEWSNVALSMLQTNPGTAYRLLKDTALSGNATPPTAVLQNAGTSVVGQCLALFARQMLPQSTLITIVKDDYL